MSAGGGVIGGGCVIPYTQIAVDTWKQRQSCRARIFFLSHVEQDRLTGLTPNWSAPIYCSAISKSLLLQRISVNPALVHSLELNVPHTIPLTESSPDTGGGGGRDQAVTMTVTLIDSNHCPGSVMFLFEGYFGRVMYTGDFRLSPSILHSAVFREFISRPVDALYLDNTYCSPKCCFASQEETDQEIINIIEQNPRDKVVLGLRGLGREDLLIRLAEHFKAPVGVSEERYKAIELLFKSQQLAATNAEFTTGSTFSDTAAASTTAELKATGRDTIAATTADSVSDTSATAAAELDVGTTVTGVPVDSNPSVSVDQESKTVVAAQTTAAAAAVTTADTDVPSIITDAKTNAAASISAAASITAAADSIKAASDGSATAGVAGNAGVVVCDIGEVRVNVQAESSSDSDRRRRDSSESSSGSSVATLATDSSSLAVSLDSAQSGDKTSKFLEMIRVIPAGRELSLECRIDVIPLVSITRPNLDSWNRDRPTVVILGTAVFSALGFQPFPKDVYVVELSRHSSYTELLQFVSTVRPKSVVPLARGVAAPGGPGPGTAGAEVDPLATALPDRASIECFQDLLDKTPIQNFHIPQAVLELMNQADTSGAGQQSNAYRSGRRRRTLTQSDKSGRVSGNLSESECDVSTDSTVVGDIGRISNNPGQIPLQYLVRGQGGSDTAESLQRISPRTAAEAVKQAHLIRQQRQQEQQHQARLQSVGVSQQRILAQKDTVAAAAAFAAVSPSRSTDVDISRSDILVARGMSPCAGNGGNGEAIVLSSSPEDAPRIGADKRFDRLNGKVVSVPITNATCRDVIRENQIIRDCKLEQIEHALPGHPASISIQHIPLSDVASATGASWKVSSSPKLEQEVALDLSISTGNVVTCGGGNVASNQQAPVGHQEKVVHDVTVPSSLTHASRLISTNRGLILLSDASGRPMLVGSPVLNSPEQRNPCQTTLELADAPIAGYEIREVQKFHCIPSRIHRDRDDQSWHSGKGEHQFGDSYSLQGVPAYSDNSWSSLANTEVKRLPYQDMPPLIHHRQEMECSGDFLSEAYRPMSPPELIPIDPTGAVRRVSHTISPIDRAVILGQTASNQWQIGEKTEMFPHGRKPPVELMNVEEYHADMDQPAVPAKCVKRFEEVNNRPNERLDKKPGNIKHMDSMFQNPLAMRRASFSDRSNDALKNFLPARSLMMTPDPVQAASPGGIQEHHVQGMTEVQPDLVQSVADRDTGLYAMVAPSSHGYYTFQRCSSLRGAKNSPLMMQSVVERDDSEGFSPGVPSQNRAVPRMPQRMEMEEAFSRRLGPSDSLTPSAELIKSHRVISDGFIPGFTKPCESISSMGATNYNVSDPQGDPTCQGTYIRRSSVGTLPNRHSLTTTSRDSSREKYIRTLYGYEEGLSDHMITSRIGHDDHPILRGPGRDEGDVSLRVRDSAAIRGRVHEMCEKINIIQQQPTRRMAPDEMLRMNIDGYIEDRCTFPSAASVVTGRVIDGRQARRDCMTSANEGHQVHRPYLNEQLGRSSDCVTVECVCSNLSDALTTTLQRSSLSSVPIVSLPTVTSPASFLGPAVAATVLTRATVASTLETGPLNPMALQKFGPAVYNPVVSDRVNAEGSMPELAIIPRVEMFQSLGMVPTVGIIPAESGTVPTVGSVDISLMGDKSAEIRRPDDNTKALGTEGYRRNFSEAGNSQAFEGIEQRLAQTYLDSVRYGGGGTRQVHGGDADDTLTFVKRSSSEPRSVNPRSHLSASSSLGCSVSVAQRIYHSSLALNADFADIGNGGSALGSSRHGSSEQVRLTMSRGTSGELSSTECTSLGPGVGGPDVKLPPKKKWRKRYRNGNYENRVSGSNRGVATGQSSTVNQVNAAVSNRMSHANQQFDSTSIAACSLPDLLVPLSSGSIHGTEGEQQSVAKGEELSSIYGSAEHSGNSRIEGDNVLQRIDASNSVQISNSTRERVGYERGGTAGASPRSHSSGLHRLRKLHLREESPNTSTTTSRRRNLSGDAPVDKAPKTVDVGMGSDAIYTSIERRTQNAGEVNSDLNITPVHNASKSKSASHRRKAYDSGSVDHQSVTTGSFISQVGYHHSLSLDDEFKNPNVMAISPYSSSSLSRSADIAAAHRNTVVDVATSKLLIQSSALNCVPTSNLDPSKTDMIGSLVCVSTSNEESDKSNQELATGLPSGVVSSLNSLECETVDTITISR